MIEALGARGTRAAIVLTAGLDAVKTVDGMTVTQAMLRAAKPYLFRILGPNCLGALVPGAGLNASFSHLPAQPGGIAFVSQSGALCTAVLDWAAPRDIGFSHFISVGNMADVDLGDVVDYLASDPGTKAILLYIEGVTNGRKFMSACRAAARNKPVLVIKAGVVSDGAKAAATHTGALAGSDNVYDAAFQRAGLLRVRDVEELFAAVETLARARPHKRGSLTILTNGGGIGVIATDELVQHGGALAVLADDTVAALDPVLPSNWSRRNPVDIIGDAPGSRYADALRILSKNKAGDAVLVMHAPTATADSVAAAKAVIDVAGENKINLLTCWVGGQA
ncbi:MAG: GNAT family N-acetyltransferase, partial [Proteobacteria bacterium]|nr:GNAT family N-acetyltransferase [Pseudomonadota bacterium]